MSSEYDVIVVGLGAMGSATAYQLAKRGQRVLGLDSFPAAHTFGSSHGETRIIRMAYFEHPNYVPLLRRAYALWRQAENESGQKLLHITGGLFLGRADDDIVSGSVLSARTHGLSHTMLDASQIHELYPMFAPQTEEVALYEDAAGVLFPERCMATHLHLAEQHGATLRHAEPVLEVLDGAVRTESQTYRAGRVVVTLGAWFNKLLPDIPVTAKRVPLLWFQPLEHPQAFDLGRFPIVIWQTPDFGDFYLTPHVSLPGVKIGKHHPNPTCDPATVDRTVSQEDERPLRDFLESRIPSLAGPVTNSAVCMYENSPDLHFLVDRHPTMPNVVIGAGFSGHGFKFASVIGSLLADLAITGQTTAEADFLRFGRLASVP